LLTSEKVRQVEAAAGVYVIADADSHEIVYIGQSKNVAERLLSHGRITRADKTLQFSYQIIGLSVPPHNLKEIENSFFHT